MRSIQARLLLFLSLTLVAVIAAAGARLYRDTHREIDALFDAQLAESARLLLAQAGHELHEDDDNLDDEWLEAIDDPKVHKGALVFQLWDRDGRLRFRSTPRLETSPLSQVDQGFSDVTARGHRLRVYSTWDRKHRLQIQVAQAESRRIAISAKVTRDLMLPLLAMLPVSLIAVWVAVRSSLRGLNAVTAQVAGMTPRSLQPITGPVPAEIEPLVHATNELLGRLERAMELERRFTADAAHELRTPLAAIRAQTEAALGAGASAERVIALGHVLEGVDRATRSVEQLLTLARLDPQAQIPKEAVDLHAVAQYILSHAAQGALNRNVELELTGEAELQVQGDPDLLRLLVRNLVDNAIRYAPRDTTVTVHLAYRGGRPSLCVTDAGPGIAPEHRARVFDRFFRLQGAPGEGSGLGLAIVRQIAEHHGAQVFIDGNPTGPGAQFTVVFPPVSPETSAAR